MTGEKPCRFLIHERDSIYSSEYDSALMALDLTILKTPFRAPKATAFWERLVGSMRRGCLDFLIPLNKSHLRRILKEWVAHYNKGRPHSSLGPGIPEPSGRIPVLEISGHRIPGGQRGVASAALAGPHHEYRLEKLQHERQTSLRKCYLRAQTGLQLPTSCGCPQGVFCPHIASTVFV